MEEKRAHIFLLNTKLTLINFLYINFFPHGFVLQQGKLVSDVYIMISVFNYSKKDLFQCHILRLLVKFYKYFLIYINKGIIVSSFQKENCNREIYSLFFCKFQKNRCMILGPILFYHCWRSKVKFHNSSFLYSLREICWITDTKN